MLNALLPGYVYHADQIFRREVNAIFGNGWVFIGHANELKEPGAFMEGKAGSESVFLVRARNGDISGFINVCPHRGARLVSGRGQCTRGNIVCPYHAWTFDAEGALVGVPAQKHYLPDLRTADHRLKKVRVQQWRGLLFVTLSDSAPDLVESLRDFPAYLQGYEESFEDLELVTTVSFDEAVNWKVIVENYVEDYHFSFVHPDTLKVFDHPATQTEPSGDHIRIYMPYRKTRPVGPCKYPWKEGGGSQQGFIWPLTTIQPAVDHLSIFQIVPVSSERTLIHIPVYQTPRQQRAYPLDVCELHKSIKQDMEEDFVICRLLQQNVRSAHYRVGALSSPHEAGVRHFASTWKRYMEA
jgi:phenylpropionate dioxygenase-like ring-hydroxylating dioxygenase large terminal subunit